MGKVKYSEPADYFPASIRKQMEKELKGQGTKKPASKKPTQKKKK